MASQRIYSIALAVAIVCIAQLGGVNAQNLNSASVTAACNTKFNATLAQYYANDTTCAKLIYAAFNGTVTSQCMSTVVGSPVQMCMNKNDTGGIADAWATLIVSCEYMYIANRQGAGESEAAYTYNDDSCFQAFDSWTSFTAWLYDTSGYGSKTGTPPSGGHANMATVTASSIFAAVLLAIFVFFQ